MTISFGTDGWRAVISDTFTFTNLRLVAQAIADAAASPDWNRLPSSPAGPSSREMVVGFDTRFLSDRYAVEVARVLAANGYNERVFVRGDTSVDYGRVMEVMAMLSAAGFTHIGLVTAPPKPKADEK